MSNRLNQEREAMLQPKRISECKAKLEQVGMKIIYEDGTRLDFIFKGHKVQFWPYSGWHSGKSIKDGRGFNNLLKQLKQVSQ